MVTRKRSWAKALSWRVMAFFTLGLIAYLVTGNLKEMGMITLIFNAVQIMIYYIHERVWLKIKYGQHPLFELEVKKPLSDKAYQQVEEKLRELGYID